MLFLFFVFSQSQGSSYHEGINLNFVAICWHICWITLGSDLEQLALVIAITQLKKCLYWQISPMSGMSKHGFLQDEQQVLQSLFTEIYL